MTDRTFNINTTDNGNEWDINGAGGSRDVEVEYEYPAGYMCGFSTSYLYLNRADLVAMLAALDAETA